jgi:hypothetical protein
MFCVKISLLTALLTLCLIQSYKYGYDRGESTQIKFHQAESDFTEKLLTKYEAEVKLRKELEAKLEPVVKDIGNCRCPYCTCTQTGPVPGQPCVCTKKRCEQYKCDCNNWKKE